MAIYAAIAYLAPLDDRTVARLSDVAWLVFSLAAAARSFVTARRGKGAQRRGWMFLGAAALSWAAGMVYLLVNQWLDPSFPPYPTLANYLFVGFAPLFMVGLFELRPPTGPRVSVASRVANLALIAFAVVVSTTIVLYEPLLQTRQPFEVTVFSIVDPAAFLAAALFALALRWLRGLAVVRAAADLLVAAIVLHATADLVYFSWVQSGGLYELHIEFVWLLAFTAQIVAAHLGERDAKPLASRAPSPSRSEPVQAVLPAALILLMVGTALLYWDNMTERWSRIGLPVLVLFGLTLGLREWLADRREGRLFRSLERSEHRFRELLATSPAVLFTSRPEREPRATFVSRNVEPEFGVPAEDPTLWASRVHPDDAAAERADFTRVLDTSAAGSEFRLLDGSGDYRWVYRRLLLTRDEQGDPREVVGSMIDITPIKRLESKLLRTQRLEAVGKLAGGIAHDFNNLLTTILGSAELALADPRTADAARGHLEAIEAAGLTAADMTRQLLTFSSRHAVRLERIDVNEVVGEISRLLLRLLPEDVELTVVERASEVAILSDRGQLEQLVVNLVLNSRDAMPDGGSLVIEIDRAIDPDGGAHAVLTVSDEGTGMEEEVAARAFEPFFSTKPRDRGTGLGLSTVHGIVHQHGGTVELSSTPGFGTTVQIRLPVTDAPPAAAPAPAATVTAAGRGERLLVVEDDAAIAGLLERALGRAGYTVETASSAEAGLERARARSRAYDLLLTDIVLPGINGRRLAEIVRDERLADRVIFMSGYTDDLRLLKGIERGDVPLLRKPMRLDEVVSTVSDVLSRDPRAGLPSPATGSG